MVFGERDGVSLGKLIRQCRKRKECRFENGSFEEYSPSLLPCGTVLRNSFFTRSLLLYRLPNKTNRARENCTSRCQLDSGSTTPTVVDRRRRDKDYDDNDGDEEDGSRSKKKRKPFDEKGERKESIWASAPETRTYIHLHCQQR
jgi:hypothetical protein